MATCNTCHIVNHQSKLSLCEGGVNILLTINCSLDLRERHHDNKMLSKPSDDNSATVLDGKEKLIESEKAATGKVSF